MNTLRRLIILVWFATFAETALSNIYEFRNIHFGTEAGIATINTSNFGSNRYTNFTFLLGYRELKLGVMANALNYTFFEQNNYRVGDRDSRKIPFSSWGVCARYVPQFHTPRYFQWVCGFDFIETAVYGGWIETHTLSGNTVYKTINFDNLFRHYLMGIGFQSGWKNKTGFQLMLHTGLNYNRPGNFDSNYFAYFERSYDKRIRLNRPYAGSIMLSLKIYGHVFFKK
jgi:hypothetical protein